MPGSSKIISINVDNLSFDESLQQVTEWGLERRPGFVCFANVHMTIEAHTDPSFRKMLGKAMLVLPDGKPLALACRWLYGKKQERVAGMDFMPAILAKAHQLNARIFLYGSTSEVLDRIIQRVNSDYPGAVVAGSISPPFRSLTEAEIQDHIRQINESGAHFVLVALGCPKQEKWMAAHYSSIKAVLLGVGGVFPVVAGIQKRSPLWMQRFALEWLYRLFQEPKRLFKRYLSTNCSFIWLLGKEIIHRKLILKRNRPYQE